MWTTKFFIVQRRRINAKGLSHAVAYELRNFGEGGRPKKSYFSIKFFENQQELPVVLFYFSVSGGGGPGGPLSRTPLVAWHPESPNEFTHRATHVEHPSVEPSAVEL